MTPGWTGCRFAGFNDEFGVALVLSLKRLDSNTIWRQRRERYDALRYINRRVWMRRSLPVSISTGWGRLRVVFLMRSCARVAVFHRRAHDSANRSANPQSQQFAEVFLECEVEDGIQAKVEHYEEKYDAVGHRRDRIFYTQNKHGNREMRQCRLRKFNH